MIVLFSLASLAADPVEFAPTLASGSKWTLTEEVYSSLPWEGGSLGSRTVTVSELDVRNGGTIGKERITLDVEVVALRSEEMRGQETVVWDSKEKKKPDENQAIYAALVGDEYTATMEADGSVSATTDAKAFEKRLLAHGIDQEIVSLVTSIVNAESRGAQTRQMLWQLPRGPLAIGQVWTSTVEDKSGVPLEWRWKLTSVEAGVATFDLGVDLPEMPMIEGMTCAGAAVVEVKGTPRSITIDCTGKNTAVDATQTIRTAVTWKAR